MSGTVSEAAKDTRWEHFDHGADVGVRGIGSTLADAFEQASLALTAVVTSPESVRARRKVRIDCQATNSELLFADWLNAVVFEMASRRMLFGRYSVQLKDGHLIGEAWGEPVDRERHRPRVEVKGATYTELRVDRLPGERGWVAQTVLDV